MIQQSDLRLGAFTLFLLVFAIAAWGKSDDNVIITNAAEEYLIETSKGDKMGKVKAKCELVFTARRVDEKVMALEYYNSFITIDKASAPDTKPVYLPDIDNGIFYDDSKMCALYFDVKKGKSETVRFEKTYTQPEYFTVISLAESYFVKNKTVTITIPEKLADKIRVVEKSFTPNIVSRREVGKNGNVTYTYTITDLDCFVSEQSAVYIGRSVPRIYICGHFANVNELYEYLHQYTTGDDPGIEGVNALAKELTANCASDAERIECLTYWVHNNIRYIAVEHGEYGQRPDLAGEVLRKRYGDCKGMSSLLKALLKAVGIDARLTWIGTTAIEQDWEEIPNISSGNHMICSVVNGDSVLYLDCTASYMPIGCYHHSIQGKQTIIENGETCILHRVPIQPASVNTDKLCGEMCINGNNLDGSLTNVITGYVRMAFCSSLNSIDASKRNDYIESYMGYPRKNAKITNLKITGDAVTDTETTVSAEISEPDACQHLGDAIYVELHPFRTSIIDTYDLKDRRRDIQLPSRRCLESDFKVKIPEGFSVASLPTPCAIENEWFTCDIVYDADNEYITCKAKLTINNTLLTIDKATAWNKEARKFKQANTEQITLRKN